jgi:hypothetical protein
MNEERLQVGVAIVFPGFVVLVVLAKGCEVFQPLVDVFD